MDVNATMTNVGLGKALGHNGPPERLPLEGLELLQGCLQFAQETRRQVDAARASGNHGESMVLYIDMHEPALRILGAALLKATVTPYSRPEWLQQRLAETRSYKDTVDGEDRMLHLRVRIFELLNKVGIIDAMEQLSYDARKAFERAEWAEMSEAVDGVSSQNMDAS